MMNPQRKNEFIRGSISHYPWLNCRHFRILWEIGVEEHACDIRFKSGSGNMAVSCMRNVSGHNYRNSLFIVDLAMGQIPRSTERISSNLMLCCWT